LPEPNLTNQIIGPPKKKGGPSFHKPGCQCYPCASRRRKAEALLDGDGVETHDSDKNQVINADLPALVAKDRTGRGRITEWIAMRALEPNISNNEVAERLGIQPHSLNSLIGRAVREGWLKFDNPLDRMEHEIIPLTMDKLKKLIKDDDKTAIIETAKGVIYPMFKESRGMHENQQTVLAIKIEYPKKDSNSNETVDAKVIGSGNIVGKPNIFEGDA